LVDESEERKARWVESRMKEGIKKGKKKRIELCWLVVE